MDPVSPDLADAIASLYAASSYDKASAIQMIQNYTAAHRRSRFRLIEGGTA